METTHPAHSIPAAPARARRPRFEQDTSSGWLVVIPVVMAACVGLTYWVHALSLGVR